MDDKGLGGQFLEKTGLITSVYPSVCIKAPVDLDLETLNNLTKTQKLLIFFLAVVLVFGAFIWFVFIPKSDQIARIEREIVKLNDEINVNRVKVRRLDILRRENRVLQLRLAEQKEQLPGEAEIDQLLKQVSELGGRSGLNFKLWKPGPRKENVSGLYLEIPVNIEVSGGYHSVGAFFDKISNLKRIINVSNIKMVSAVSAKGGKPRTMIQTSFSATAFATITEAESSEEKTLK